MQSGGIRAFMEGLTSRQAVLQEDINRLLGVGYYSFWSEERNQRLSKGFYYLLGEAHNGYMQTYLNSGIIGVTLLLSMIGSAGKLIKQKVLEGSSFGALRLAFLITIVIYNVTESAFDRLVPVWFAMVLVVLEYPRPVEGGIDEEVEPPFETANPSQTEGIRAGKAKYAG